MKQKKEWYLIILLNLIIMLPIILMKTKLGHDMNFHLANIDVLANNLNLDSFIHGFIIRPEIANNLGYGIGIFYPMLPHLIGAITYKFLSLFGISIVTSTYILYFFISVISSFLIYNLALKLHKNKQIALISCVIYLIMPYFLGNMFVRFAFNEVFFFMFFLILLNGLFYYQDHKIKSFYLFFIIGYTGMIFSHLVLSLFVSIFFLIFIIVNFNKMRNNLKPILIGIGVVTILVLPSILLLLPHQFSNYYVFNQPGIMTSKLLVTQEALDINKLVIPLSDYSWDVPLYIPLLIIILIIGSLIYLFKNRKKVMNKNILYILITLGLSLYMILNIFPWCILPEILMMIQFPWRLLGVLVIAISLIAPIFLLQFKDKRYFNKLIGITIIALLLVNIPFTNKLYKRIYNYKEYNINEAMGHQNEYLPNELVNDFVNRGNNIISNDPNAYIQVLENDKRFQFKVDNVNKYVMVELPKLYYYGYTLKCDQNHYHKVEYKNGYISSKIDHNGTYTLVYNGTIPYIITRIIRIIFIVSFCLYFIIKYLKNKKVMI